MKTRQWIVVANASHARILEGATHDQPLALLDTLEHPGSRLKGSELGTDRPGREAADNSHGGNRFEPRSDPRRKEHRSFAREIAERLEAACARHEFDALALVASSPFLGELKKELGEEVRRRVGITLDSDWTTLTLGPLEQRLRQLQPDR